MPDAEAGILAAVPARLHDLLTARGTAVLATVDRNGRPQSTAVWYIVDDDGLLKLSTTAGRQKYKNLRANPSCTLFLMDPTDTHRTLELRADAELVADPDCADIQRFATAYGLDPARVVADDRHTIVLHVYRVVASPA